MNSKETFGAARLLLSALVACYPSNAVLLSYRRTNIEEIDASVGTTAFVHTGYRVHVVDNRNVVCDDDLFLPAIARVGRISRPVLTVILAGRARVRVAEVDRWLEAGDVALLPSKAAVAMRQEGESFRSIAIEWDEGLLGGAASSAPGVIRTSATDAARAAEIARALESCTSASHAAALLADLVAFLRALGASFARVGPRDLIEPVAEPVVRLSHALDAVLSRLEEGPAMSDLDARMGLSARQINRVVARFNERYGFNSSGWRDTRNRRRLLVGATMMTAPGARTELVARAMGYALPTSFCHAFDDARLPSPGGIADVVERLR